MPSTNKTSFLLLNSWVASDAPKMTDFNSDNQKLDDAIRAHHENAAIHLTAAQKSWLSQPMSTGTYTGNGDALRTVTLGFQPAMVILFAQGCAPVEFDISDQFSIQRFALGAGAYATPGLSILATGFQATQHQNDPIAGMYRLNLNENGINYVYFVLK